MKIAIYHNLPSGGGKRALHEMTRRLANRHDIDVYTLTCAEHDFCDLRPYVRRYIVSPFSPLPLARRPFGRLNQGIRTLELLRLHKAQRRIAHQIDTIQYDVVFVHHCRFAQSPSLLSFLRTRAVYYCQEPPRFIYEPYIPRPYATFSRAQQVGNLLDPLPHFHRSVMTRLDPRIRKPPHQCSPIRPFRARVCIASTEFSLMYVTWALMSIYFARCPCSKRLLFCQSERSIHTRDLIFSFAA